MMLKGTRTNTPQLTTDILYRIQQLEEQVRRLTELQMIYSFGLEGHEYVAAEASSTSGQTYGVIEATAATTIDYTEASTGTISNRSMYQGERIYGTFTSVSVDAGGGDVRLYKKNLITIS